MVTFITVTINRCDELEDIAKRIASLCDESAKYSENMNCFIELYQEELNEYKIKLENCLAEADDKVLPCSLKVKVDSKLSVIE